MSLSGSLTVDSVPIVYRKVQSIFKDDQLSDCKVELKGITEFDDCAANFLQWMASQFEHRGIQCQTVGQPDGLNTRMKLYRESHELPEDDGDREVWVAHMGFYAYKKFEQLLQTIAFIGEVSTKTLGAMVRPTRISWDNLGSSIYNAGPRGLSIIALVGFVFGLILAFQGALALNMFGAQSYIPQLVCVAMSRELAPLMVAVVVIGRSASSFAAEIGAMKVNQEIDALITMEIDPVRYLIVPRVIGVMLMMPLMVIYMFFFALVGCGLVMMSLGYSLDLYVTQLHMALQLGDLLVGLVKSLVFGVIIAGIGCLWGMRAKISADSIGLSATTAVVHSIIVITIVDGVFSSILYVLGV